MSNVLNSIGISDETDPTKDTADKELKQEVTESILNAVSNLVKSDLKIADNRTETKSASKISGR